MSGAEGAALADGAAALDLVALGATWQAGMCQLEVRQVGVGAGAAAEEPGAEENGECVPLFGSTVCNRAMAQEALGTFNDECHYVLPPSSAFHMVRDCTVS